MAEHAHTTSTLTDPLAELRALVATPSPDARLLIACDQLLVLREEVDRLYKREPRGYMRRVRETMLERDALEFEIASTPARTPAGRRAKAEVGLTMLQGMGSVYQIARSALVDFVNSPDVRGGAGRWWPLPVVLRSVAA